jgi:ribosomal protein L10
MVLGTQWHGTVKRQPVIKTAQAQRLSSLPTRYLYIVAHLSRWWRSDSDLRYHLDAIVSNALSIAAEY